MTTLLRMFERVDIYINLGNTKSMPFTPGFIWVQMGNEAYKLHVTGEGANFWESKQTQVSYGKCGTTMA